MSVTSVQHERSPGLWIAVRWVARAISVVLLVPIVMLMVLAITTPLTISGALYVAGFVAIVIGVWSIIWGYTRYRRVLWLGLGVMVMVAVVRLLRLNSSSPIQLLVLPEQSSPCLMSCLFDEQDVALFSTRVLSLIGWISPDEQAGLLDAMYTDYRDMADVQPIIPSPFMRTYLGQQRPGAFDAVVIEPTLHQPPQMGVIFLHGFTGNFTMPCWLVAQAVDANQGVTVCPSVDWQGEWWTSDGETTLRATIEYLHQRGVNRIYLAGLSNGAVGASELAYQLTDAIAGLILISGASPNAIDSHLPTLILAGSRDKRMPIDMMQAYAQRMGSQAAFVELQADHFMLAKNDQQIQSQIAAWLRQREADHVNDHI